VRGGSCNDNRNNARCAYRNRNNPDNWNNNVGLRVVVAHAFRNRRKCRPVQRIARGRGFETRRGLFPAVRAIPGGRIQKRPAPCGRPDLIWLEAWGGAGNDFWVYPRILPG
jgi:hypothetical protein